MYNNLTVNSSARKLTSKKLDKVLDDILKSRINRNSSLSKPNTQLINNVRPVSERKSRKRKNGPRSGQPILDDVLKLKYVPNIQPVSIFTQFQVGNQSGEETVLD